MNLDIVSLHSTRTVTKMDIDIPYIHKQKYIRINTYTPTYGHTNNRHVHIYAHSLTQAADGHLTTPQTFGSIDKTYLRRDRSL